MKTEGVKSEKGDSPFLLNRFKKAKYESLISKEQYMRIKYLEAFEETERYIESILENRRIDKNLKR